MPISRRTTLKSLAASSLGAVLAPRATATGAEPIVLAGRPVEIDITPVGDHIVRISIIPLDGGRPAPILSDGSLVQPNSGEPAARVTSLAQPFSIELKSGRVAVSADPLIIRVDAADGRRVQELRCDAKSAGFGFQLGDGPVLGLGEGGQQFDRRGSVDRMRSGQGGYRLRTHGGRVPIPWLIGTAGWAMFVHQPAGTFDLSAAEGRFVARDPAKALPIDLFVVTAREPAHVMAAYARLTGLPEMPPVWALGYQQSHRTLAGPEDVLAVARTFRDRRLPCDVLIYLGTGFCPSGWNTGHGSFAFNKSVFPDPKKMIDELHKQHFHVVPHVVIRARSIEGTVRDPVEPGPVREDKAASYWNGHRETFALGIDGWWPDEGDPLDVPSRLARNRMYWEGPQLDRPGERPYALHRNGYAGMQRYGAFLWSGDVYSTWETLKAHVPIAINAALSGLTYWGTDTGGFVPTKELTGELYVRWFQFSAFCPLFRSHGRTWKLRLPWGWNTGELGPDEIRTYGEAANPGPNELHNAAVEPICRQYLELRYRLLPYLYSTVREGRRTGMPIIRPIYFYAPDDAKARACGNQYFWGANMMIAPVTEKGATSRRVYLPRGQWYDFFSGESVAGEREIDRPVDLATMPIYVRAGAILPLGPVKQYTSENVQEPLSIRVYPGADGRFMLYEDDGTSFDYRSGEWMGVEFVWHDRDRQLMLSLAEGSRMRPPQSRLIVAGLVNEKATVTIRFDGRTIGVKF
jgi:alpha-glucosidase (family GH31 glycosyl hydrolase)